jgi:hypothetical protein
VVQLSLGAVLFRDCRERSDASRPAPRKPVKLPFLNVELPLKAFFVLGPLVFLIVHACVLLHFVLLAARSVPFMPNCGRRWPGSRQLPSNIFEQSLAGPREVRNGIIGLLLRLIVQISLVAGPIFLSSTLPCLS